MSLAISCSRKNGLGVGQAHNIAVQNCRRHAVGFRAGTIDFVAAESRMRGLGNASGDGNSIPHLAF